MKDDICKKRGQCMEILIFKLSLALVFSAIIGYEREMSESYAGFKTHIIVGVSSAVIGIIQLGITQHVFDLNMANPDVNTGIRSDPTRLIAQVISGIGFLGAGTIIVTEQKISGLTTAASIWTVAILGLGIGMGYYKVTIIGLLLIVGVLYIFNRIIVIQPPEKILIRFLKGENCQKDIDEAIKKMDMEIRILSFGTETYGNELVNEVVYQVSDNDFNFDEFIRNISKIPNVMSVEKTNL